MRWLPRIAVLGAALALIACNVVDDTGDDGREPGGPSLGMGPGISVSEALASDLDGPLLVNGYLVVVDGEVRLCELLAESYPPQCGGASLVVEGLDLSAYSLTREGGVSWTDGHVQVLGEVKDRRLVVSAASAG
jgi:hypothetical protein